MQIKKDEKWIRDQFLTHFNNRDFHVLANDGLIGGHERDIVILDRDNAILLVLEAKAWSIDLLTDIEGDNEKWNLRYIGEKKHPQKQADEALKEVLKKLSSEMKKDIFYFSGVVFTEIVSAEKDRSEVLRALDPTGVVLWGDAFGDELKKIYNLEINRVFRERQWYKKSFRNHGKNFEDIVKKIDPKINMPRKGISNAEVETQKADKLVSRIQYGHHRLNGVVGSGKTFFLVRKLRELINKYLDQTTDFLEDQHKVLVLTKTRTCKSKIIQDCLDLFGEQEMAVMREFIRFETFGKFIHQDYKIFQSDIQKKVQLEKVDPVRKYECIIVDEFQDFEETWGPFLYRHVGKIGKEDGLFLMLFDPAQSNPGKIVKLFGELEHEFDLTWASREHYMKVCYRLPDRIGQFAINGYKSFHGEELEEIKEETVTKVITKSLKPEFHEKGGKVEFVPVLDVKDEALDVAIFIGDKIKNENWLAKDIALIIPPEKEGENKVFELFSKIKDSEPSIRFLLFDSKGNARSDEDNRDVFFKRGNVVSVISPMRIKGLEIPYVVCTPSAVNHFSNKKQSGAFYQAVTRALDTVVMMGDERQISEYRKFVSEK
jgi:hypothetical protein